MYFHVQASNFHGFEIASFLRKVRRAVGRNLYVVWDRLNGHRTAQSMLSDLMEQVWAHTKHGDLANASYGNALDLLDAVFDSLYRKQHEHALFANFFSHEQLPL